MTAQEPVLRQHGNSYNIFILVLTLASLLIMVLLILPWMDDETKQLLLIYDNVICFVFLADFVFNLTGSKPKSGYFIHQRGWLDLLGSIPTLGFFQYTALLRLARLSRLARISRILRGKNRSALVKDVVENRGQYATFITLLAAGIVLSSASILMLQAELRSPEANITTGGDSLWWALVTITTVGYGDHYPVTPEGRTIATFVMFAGVGIIGALASILASLLVPSPKEKPAEEVAAEAAAEAVKEVTAEGVLPAVADDAALAGQAGAAVGAAPAGSADVAQELARLREEIAELRRTLQGGGAETA